MRKEFSKSWKGSAKKRKQVKFVKKAPLHAKNKMLSAHLSKELSEKHGTRNITIRKGDKVKIMRGGHKGKTGKVSRVDLTRGKIFVEGVETVKVDGSKSRIALFPSNTMIVEASFDDKRRMKRKEK